MTEFSYQHFPIKNNFSHSSFNFAKQDEFAWGVNLSSISFAFCYTQKKNNKK